MVPASSLWFRVWNPVRMACDGVCGLFLLSIGCATHVEMYKIEISLSIIENVPISKSGPQFPRARIRVVCRILVARHRDNLREVLPFIFRLVLANAYLLSIFNGAVSAVLTTTNLPCSAFYKDSGIDFYIDTNWPASFNPLLLPTTPEPFS
jgi:hypothetical protein